jgi:FdhD protein
MLQVAQPMWRRRFSARQTSDGERLVAEEAPVALVHNATTTAVMMATPADLEDLAYGFALSEGITADLSDIREVEIADAGVGLEARMWLMPRAGEALARRRRHIAGPTGCGLCGVDSLVEAARPAPAVRDTLRLPADAVRAALASLEPAQSLGAATRAVHAAGWWTLECGLVAAREDVGRHNALDKLVGALVRSGASRDGVLVLTSRVSVEMVQKAAIFGAQLIVAMSAPTALAIRTAQAAGITLVAVARRDGFEIFTHPHRLD